MYNNILLVDDNSEFLISLYKYIKREIPYINIVGLATDGVEANMLVKELNPNIILLDLNMPNLNGIKFIENLAVNNVDIILISGDIKMINDLSLKQFYNIHNVFIKPFNFQLLKKDLEFLVSIDNGYKLENLINKKMSEFDFNQNSIAYKYFIACIKEVYNHPEKLNNIEKFVFPVVAHEFKIDNSKSIKWAVQKLMNSMVRYTKREIILENFPYTTKPTTKMFLNMMNQYLKQKYK